MKCDLDDLAAGGMTREEFQEALLTIMEQKIHWAWPLFESGKVTKEKLHLHLESEYGTYVRDFPILVARAYVQCPHAEVRRELIENIYEEETGALAAGKPHGELFLLYPQGLGMDIQRFRNLTLMPSAAEFREKLNRLTLNEGWELAAAVTTLFLEGTSFERGELDPLAAKRPTPPLTEHPLVKHYDLDIRQLELTRAHRKVEGSHRAAAWRTIVNFVNPDQYAHVLWGMKEALDAWLTYRDDVAHQCGLCRPAIDGVRNTE